MGLPLLTTRSGKAMDMGELRSFVEGVWRQEVIPALIEYIRIPNKSPLFDQKWREHGHMKKAVDLLADWARAHVRKIPGAKLDVICLEDRTPVIFIDIPGVGENLVLLYGHLDKQPEMSGWSEGLGPWTPVLKDEKLYGWGGRRICYFLLAFGGSCPETAIPTSCSMRHSYRSM